jgi:hypothetical protein
MHRLKYSTNKTPFSFLKKGHTLAYVFKRKVAISNFGHLLNRDEAPLDMKKLGRNLCSFTTESRNLALSLSADQKAVLGQTGTINRHCTLLLLSK